MGSLDAESGGSPGVLKKSLLPTAAVPCFICRTQNMNAQSVPPSDLGPAKFAADS
jgi:hypothetical protein